MSLILLTIRFGDRLVVNKAELLLPYIAFSANEFQLFSELYSMNHPILVKLPEQYR